MKKGVFTTEFWAVVAVLAPQLQSMFGIGASDVEQIKQMIDQGHSSGPWLYLAVIVYVAARAWLKSQEISKPKE